MVIQLTAKTMELTSNHRRALLSELEDAMNDRELQKRLLDKADNKADKEWREITHFLAIERQNRIKSAISLNEIDY